MTDTPIITRQLVEGEDRMLVVEKRFSIHFPFMIEPMVCSIAGKLTRGAYDGGYWHFYELSNGGFYMSPDGDRVYRVSCDNYWQGDLSADALGIVCTLYAYSHLSFSRNMPLARTCAEHYYRLRSFMANHAEVAAILGATD